MKKIPALLLALILLLSLAAFGAEAVSLQTEEPAAAESPVSASDSASSESEASPHTQFVIPADGTVSETGSLTPAWAEEGASGTYILGVDVHGSAVTGNIPEAATVGEDGSVSISGVSVSSELGDALDDVDATNTGFLYVAGTDDDTNVFLSDSTLTFSDNSDGSNANDFTGLGSVIVATGSESTSTTLTMDRLDIRTDGFCRDGILVDAYANALLTNSSICTAGSNPLTESYAGYASTAAQAYMISPPWVLGIYGGTRASNIIGTHSSLTVADSTLESGSWAVISTDDCTDPTLNVVNSTLRITGYNGDPASSICMNGGAELFSYDSSYGSGYATYDIGGAYENFYGVTIEGTTYAAVLTGAGPVYYGASYPGLELTNNATGESVYVAQSEARNTVVNSVFGIMAHQSAESVTLDEGSVWNTEEAVIVVRGSQDATFTVSGAELNPASGVLFQLMDNDDGYGTSGAGGDTTGDQGFAKWNGEAWGTPTFSSGFTEANEAGFASPTAGGTYSTVLNLTTNAAGDPVTYTGDIFNGTGTGADTTPGGLQVSIASGVTLNGAVSATSAVHGLPYTAQAAAYLDNLAAAYGDGIAPNGGNACTVKYALLTADGAATEDPDEAAWIQMMQFTMKEYYLISHVVNLPMAGANVIVTVDEGATWNVTGDCYITGLVNNGTVRVADGATLYVNGEPYDGASPEAGNFSS